MLFLLVKHLAAIFGQHLVYLTGPAHNDLLDVTSELLRVRRSGRIAREHQVHSHGHREHRLAADLAADLADQAAQLVHVTVHVVRNDVRPAVVGARTRQDGNEGLRMERS